MKSQLITALRQAATAVENHTFDYQWRDRSKCNCGVVACALLGKSSAELGNLMPMSNARGLNWQTLVGAYCPITGVPTQAVFKALNEFGLTALDIVQLECLTNPDVLLKLGEVKFTWLDRLLGRKPLIMPAKLQYDNRHDVVRYLRAWADLLVEQGQADSAPTSSKLDSEIGAAYTA